MGAATAAEVAGKTPADFKITCENFDQIVAADVAKGGLIAGISSPQPYVQGTAEATVGAMALLGETAPPYVVVPPLAVDRANLPQAYETIYRVPLPGPMMTDLKK